MTEPVSFQHAGHPPIPSGICRKLLLISPHLGNRSLSGQHRQIIFRFRPFKFPVHPLDIRHRPSYKLQRKLHAEFIIRLQENPFRLPKSLPHCPVCGLTEITALRMLLMSPPGQKRDFHVSHCRTGQRALMFLFLQMGQNQPLPVPVQDIFAAVGCKLHPRAPFARFQEEMHLRIMAQRFKVSHPLHRRGDGLLIHNIPFAELDQYAEPLLYKPLKHFCLHFSHELNMNLREPVLPHNMEFRLFLLKLAQIFQHHMRVASIRKLHTVCKNRFQHRKRRSALPADSLSRVRSLKAGNRAHASGFHLGDHLVLCSGVDPDLVHLSLDSIQRFLHIQTASRHFQIGQTVPLVISGNLIYLGAKLIRIPLLFHVLCDPVQEFLDSRGFQRGAKPAGKYLSLRYTPADQFPADLSALQIFLQHPLITDRQTLKPFLRSRLHVHTALTQLLPELLHKPLPVCILPVHFIHKDKCRNLIPSQKPPERNRMALHAVRRADHQHRTVQHLQNALHLGRKIRMSRCVKKRDIPVLPCENRLL